MPLDTYYIFEDAKSCYIYGQFVATVVLSTSFIEHWFAAKLHGKGHHKQAQGGLAASVQCAREKNLVAAALLDRVDRLRLIRNPFAHLKSMDHEHSLGARSVSRRQHPDEIIEADAKEALALMYAIALYAFPGP